MAAGVCMGRRCRRPAFGVAHLPSRATEGVDVQSDLLPNMRPQLHCRASSSWLAVLLRTVCMMSCCGFASEVEFSPTQRVTRRHELQSECRPSECDPLALLRPNPSSQEVALHRAVVFFAMSVSASSHGTLSAYHVEFGCAGRWVSACNCLAHVESTSEYFSHLPS